MKDLGFLKNHLILLEKGAKKEFLVLKNTILEKLNKQKEYSNFYPSYNKFIEFKEQESLFENWPKKPLVLGLFMPFCTNKCDFCNELSYNIDSNNFLREYISSYQKELLLYKPLIEKNYVSEIRFLGGTPTILSPKQLEDFLGFIKDNFYKYLDAPKGKINFYIQASPETLNKEKLTILKHFGISDIELGIQTFEEQILNNVRRHTPPEKKLFELINLIKEDFKLTLDLLVGLPGSNREILEKDLNKLCILEPDNVYISNIVVYPHTPLGDRGYYVNVEELSKYFDAYYIYLRENGYQMQNVNEYSKDPNIYVPEEELILGTGLGNLSFNGSQAFLNEDKVDYYKEYLVSGKIPVKSQYKYNKHDLEVKYILDNLKTGALYKNNFKERFNEEINDVFEINISALKYLDFLEDQTEKISLTYDGIKYWELISNFFVV